MIERGALEEVLARTDIVGLISSYVTLRRAGPNHVGLCPFHSEKSPSFTVFSGSNSFYCFGCGAGGDAVNFVRRAENLDFEDAVELLAKRAGITIMHKEDAGRPRYNRQRYYDMNKEAARFFHAQLYADNPGARAAHEYLAQKRALSEATIKHFGLGYAPAKWGVFYSHMRRLGFTDEELITGFLCGKAEADGRIYDVFRNRVMFPIIDVSGNVIAFGGRVMDDSKPKYKNTSDTPVFNKSRNLFALNYARNHCAERMVLCEGYMDVIAMHAAGFENAVATLGTAITADQARLMSRYTKSVVISYDNDEAGQNAAEKAMRLLEQVGLEVRVLKMSGAKDPDEYIKTFGAKGFASLLDESRTRFDFRMEKVLAKHNINDPQEKIKAVSALIAEIAGIYSEAERDIYVTMISARLGVDAESIRNDVRRAVRRRDTKSRKDHDKELQQKALGYADRINPDYAKAPAIARSEEAVLGMMLLYPEHRHTGLAEGGLTEQDFFTELGRRVFVYIRDAEAKDGFREAMMSESFTPDEMGRLTRMRVKRMELSDNGSEVFAESVATLKRLVSERRSADSGTGKDKLQDILNKKRNS